MEHGKDPSEGVPEERFSDRQVDEFPEPIRVHFREKYEPHEGCNLANRAHEHDEKEAPQTEINLVLHPGVCLILLLICEIFIKSLIFFLTYFVQIPGIVFECSGKTRAKS